MTNVTVTYYVSRPFIEHGRGSSSKMLQNFFERNKLFFGVSVTKSSRAERENFFMLFLVSKKTFWMKKKSSKLCNTSCETNRTLNFQSNPSICDFSLSSIPLYDFETKMSDSMTYLIVADHIRKAPLLNVLRFLSVSDNALEVGKKS